MNRYACIYIGANRVELLTAQRGAGRKLKFLDQAYYPIDLDYEIYQKGFITTKTNQLLERVVSEYARLAQESLPERFEIVFSKEVSKAENFIFLYSKLGTIVKDCNLRILTDEAEMDMFCITSEFLLSDNFDISNSNIALAAIDAENINFALTRNGIIDYIDQIPYGYVKLGELVEKITKERTHYSKLLSEIIENKLRLAVGHIGERELELISLATKDAKAIASIFENEKIGGLYCFTHESIDSAYHKLKELTPDQIQALYPNLTDAQTVTIQSTIIVARQLMNTANTDKIYLIQNNILETIVQLQFKITKRKEIRNWLDQGSYNSAIAIANRYNVDQEHADIIERFSLQLFDLLKKRFNMSKKERRILRLCCRLLDVGQYGGEEGQAEASKEIILREDIVGLSKEDRRVIARICFNSKTNNYKKTQETEGFNIEQALTIARLTAILKTTAALDQSRRQKVSKLSYSLTDTELIVKVTTSHNTQLESYYFNRDSKWIKRIFELTPVLKVKRVKVESEN